MPSILTKKYRTLLTNQFLSLFASNTAVYVFAGRPQVWVDAANGAVSDTNPPAPTDTIQNTDFAYWRDMLAVKRIASANSALVIKRIDWVANTVYTQYDDTDPALYLPTLKNFYVLDATSNPIKVYKCLWNNTNAPSGIAPSTIGTSLTPQTTSDGYVWQYMYTITSDSYTFLSSAWMPVLSDAAVQNNAFTHIGQLPTAVPLIVSIGGSGYNAAVTTTVTIIGDGANAAATSNGVTIQGGAVTQVLLSSGGSGYSLVDTVNVFQSNVSVLATCRAIIPPYPNHGFDPIKELGCSALMAVGQFAFSESNGMTTVSAYRRAGLLVGPNVANGAPATGTFYKQTWDLTVTANTGVLNPDDTIFNETKATAPLGVVVDVVRNDANTNYVVRLTNVDDKGETTPFAPGDVIKCNTSGVEVTISATTLPQLQPFSGSIVYVDQRNPVTRGPDQIEEIKLVYQLG